MAVLLGEIQFYKMSGCSHGYSLLAASPEAQDVRASGTLWTVRKRTSE